MLRAPSGRRAVEETEPRGSAPQVGTRFSAEEIHDNVSEAAQEELERPASELVWSSLASGLLLGFSFLATGFLHSIFPPELHRAASALAYPLGFVYVVHARHQLFTENTLEPVIPLLEKRNLENATELASALGNRAPAQSHRGPVVRGGAGAHTGGRGQSPRPPT